MRSETKIRAWVQSVAAAFLCVTAAVTLAVAGGHPPPEAASRIGAPSASEWVPPMHEANSGTDIGPGSDEAQLVGSPTSD